MITIPIDEGKWHRIIPEDMPLPKDHYAEYTRSEGKLIVRIVGPNAHVTGDDKNLEAAIRLALKWFSEVGEEL